jgi:hypothetical protein
MTLPKESPAVGESAMDALSHLSEPDTRIRRYWISWWQPGADCRPLHFPPKEHRVLGWWRSGTDDARTSICALVAASTEWTAKAFVAEDWPESIDAEWRFVEEKANDWMPGERFPLSGWMEVRVAQMSGGYATTGRTETAFVAAHSATHQGERE